MKLITHFLTELCAEQREISLQSLCDASHIGFPGVCLTKTQLETLVPHFEQAALRSCIPQRESFLNASSRFIVDKLLVAQPVRGFHVVFYPWIYYGVHGILPLDPVMSRLNPVRRRAGAVFALHTAVFFLCPFCSLR